MPQAFEFLREREAEWGPALRAVSLVAEIGADEQAVRDVVRTLGRAYLLADRDERVYLFTRRYPACLVTGLAGVGALEYRAGNFWSAVSEAAGLILSQADQGFLGDCFGQGLNRFRLARFPDMPLKYVGEILMHSGVPAYCLADLLNLLLRRQSKDAGLTSEEFLAWALAPGRESRLYGLDKPVQRFLKYGGEYAEDLVDRLLDLLDRLNEPGLDTTGLGLPQHLIAAAQELAGSGRLEWPSSPRLERRPRSAKLRPQLRLEPFGQGLVVWLPPVEAATGGTVVWRVRADGVVQEVVSRSSWPGATQAPPAVFALSEPVHRITIELTGHSKEYELEVVDQRDPLMVFTDEGRRLPAASSLPPGPVWLLYPLSDNQNQSLQLQVEGAPRDDYELPAPYGWPSWTLRRMDLREVAYIRLANGPRRRVEGARRAELTHTQPLPGVRSADGQPVIADPPRLTLPADAEATIEWTVQVRRFPGGEVLRRKRVVVAEDVVIDPWHGLPRPLVGTYEVMARGPLGRGLSRTLVIAEGLEVRSSPSWRSMSARGLEEAILRADSVRGGLTITPRQERLGPSTVSLDLEVRGPGGSCEVLTVTPRHMAVQLHGAGSRSGWSFQPLRLDTETSGEGELLVSLPQPADTCLIVHVGGQDVQQVSARAEHRQPLARYRLGDLADTVRRHGSAQLMIRLGDRRYPVAHYAPRRLASAVRVSDGRLVLDNGVWADGLVAGVYQLYAPWQPPVAVNLNSDLTSDPLPEYLTTAGPLVVYLRVQDPWLPEIWPNWPTGKPNVFTLSCLPWRPTSQDPATDALSGYLAGIGGYPDRPDVAPLLYPLYQHADDMRHRGMTTDVRELAADLLPRHPTAAMEALATTAMAADDLVAPMVHSRLVALPKRKYVAPSLEEKLWQVSPLAGMLVSAYHFDRLSEHPQLRDRLIDTCGDVAKVLLEGEPDPHSQVGSFDEADRLDAMPAEQLDEIWRAMRIIPGGLLDADGRLVAARQLFDARGRTDIRRVAIYVGRMLQALLPHLGKSGGPAVSAAVQARRPGHGWQSLPVLSLAMAFASRLAARGHMEIGRTLLNLLPHYVVLARNAPMLVTIDLLLAELTLSGAESVS